MGYNLNKLKKKMGVASASKVGYFGAKNPGDKPEQFAYKPDEFVFDKGTAVEAEPNQDGRYSFDHPSEGPLTDLTKAGYDSMVLDASREEREAQRLAYDDQIIIDEAAARAAYDEKYAPYEAQLAAAQEDQAAYDAYSAEYDRRLGQTPMYADEQFTGSKQFGWTGGKDSPVERPAQYTQQDRMNDTGNWYEDVLGSPSENYLGNTDAYTRDTGAGNIQTGANGIRTEDLGGGVTRYYQPDGTYSDVDTNSWMGKNFNTPFGPVNIPRMNQNTAPLDPFVDPYENLNLEDLANNSLPENFDPSLIDFDPSTFNPSGYKKGGSIRGYAVGQQPVREEISREKIVAFDEALETGSLDDQAIEAVNAGSTVVGGPVESNPVESLEGMPVGAPDRTLELMEMLNTPANRYSANIDKGRTDMQAQELKIAETLASMQKNASAGPSESEKWFRIAAAFGKPTATGNFFEGLGNVNEALADVAKERRVAKTAGDAIGLEAAQFSLGVIDKRLQSDLSLAADEREQLIQTKKLIAQWQVDYQNREADRAYDLASLEMTLEERSKRDVSEAGKMARDMGYELGSEEGNEFIRKYYEDKEAVKTLQLAELRKNANTLSTTDVKIREETVTTLDSATLVISNLEQALKYNEDALTNSFFDTARKVSEGIINASGKTYVATQNLEQILAKNAISTLKALFGGQLSDGERQASLDLEGLSSASKKVRADIIGRALATMRIVERKLNNKVRKISSGKYSQIEE